jgi:hypothetical protein
VKWENIKQLQVPVLDIKEQAKLTEKLNKAREARQRAESIESEAIRDLEDRLGLRNQKAQHRIKAAEPPS